MDRLLDQAQCGPRYLERPEIAELTVNALRDTDRRFHRYDLRAYVVMSNHVHFLATPHVRSTQWLGPMKGFIAHEANLLLGSEGRFWQDESFDHLVRNADEFRRIRSTLRTIRLERGVLRLASSFFGLVRVAAS